MEVQEWREALKNVYETPLMIERERNEELERIIGDSRQVNVSAGIEISGALILERRVAVSLGREIQKMFGEQLLQQLRQYSRSKENGEIGLREAYAHILNKIPRVGEEVEEDVAMAAIHFALRGHPGALGTQAYAGLFTERIPEPQNIERYFMDQLKTRQIGRRHLSANERKSKARLPDREEWYEDQSIVG